MQEWVNTRIGKDETIEDAKAGLVRCRHRKVAIIGAAPLRRMAPWDDDSWCFWAINEIPQPRFDRHFELHPMAVQSAGELAWLRACEAPCYTLEHEPEIPGSVRFPLERVMEATGGVEFFTCTFAYQIALAVAEGFETIGLFGVDLPWGNWRERVQENACVAYWIGYARGKGIEVVTPFRSSLASHPFRYGYDYHQEKDWVEEKGKQLLWLLREKFEGVEPEEKVYRVGG